VIEVATHAQRTWYKRRAPIGEMASGASKGCWWYARAGEVDWDGAGHKVGSSAGKRKSSNIAVMLPESIDQPKSGNPCG
jgi:hypothetical protein